MSSDISDKDNKDWKNFLSNNEKLPNKDEKFTVKKTFSVKSFDLHGYSLDEANNKINDLINTLIYCLDNSSIDTLEECLKDKVIGKMLDIQFMRLFTLQEIFKLDYISLLKQSYWGS